MVIDPVVLTLSNNNDHINNISSSPCRSHDYSVMRPIVLASWRLAQHAAASDAASTPVAAEPRSLREPFAVPGSHARLVYSSAKARGYLSTLELRLTPEEIPKTLRKVRLKHRYRSKLNGLHYVTYPTYQIQSPYLAKFFKNGIIAA